MGNKIGKTTIRPCYPPLTPLKNQMLTFELANPMQAADEVEVNHLGGAAEGGLVEVLGGRGEYRVGFCNAQGILRHQLPSLDISHLDVG